MQNAKMRVIKIYQRINNNETTIQICVFPCVGRGQCVIDRCGFLFEYGQDEVWLNLRS